MRNKSFENLKPVIWRIKFHLSNHEVGSVNLVMNMIILIKTFEQLIVRLNSFIPHLLLITGDSNERPSSGVRNLLVVWQC